MVRILKSMPIVVMNDGVQASSQKRRSKHDLPTPAEIESARASTMLSLKLLTGVSDKEELDQEVVVWVRHCGDDYDDDGGRRQVQTAPAKSALDPEMA